MLHVCSVRRRADRQKMGVPSLQNRHQKRVVEWPSLNSPKQSGGDGWCWANLQNTVFYGLKRKRRDFERSVLKYVSIKIPALTHSGRKSRVCVNAADRLLPPEQRTISLCLSLNRKFLCILPCGHEFSPSGEVLDACAARGKVGPVMGLRPLLGPPCIPPEAPPKKVFNFLQVARARVLRCGSFPHSLRSLR